MHPPQGRTIYAEASIYRIPKLPIKLKR